ncbi:MAG: hypothetical protein AAGF11_38500 [Myxococcota bacterium]
MSTPCFYLDVHIRGYDAEVFINGAPILRSHQSHAIRASPAVSEWVVQGRNEVRVVIEPSPGGDQPPGSGDDSSASEPPLVRVALCEGEVGELVEPGQERELAVLDGQPPPDDSLAHDQALTVSLSHPWGRWRWEDGVVFDPVDAAERAELTSFLSGIVSSVAANQLDPLLDASRINFEEVAPCYEFSPAAARSRLPSAWSEIVSLPGWALAPFDPEELELRRCCGGRVLEPRTRTGEPILRQVSVSEGPRWMFPMFLSRLDGRLEIVR